MKKAGRLTSKPRLVILAAVGAIGALSCAVYVTAAYAGDSAAAETLAADALYERVGDSTTTSSEAIAESPSPSSTPSPAQSAASPATASPPSPVAAAAVPVPASSPAAAPSPAMTSGTPAVTTETVEVPDTMPAPAFSAQSAVVQQSTTEVPSTGTPQGQASPATTDPDAEDSEDDNEIVNYQNWQNDPASLNPRLHSLQEFMSEGAATSPLGIEVRQAQAKLMSGRITDGLLVVDVVANSPAEKAGLHPLRRTVSNVLKGVAVAGALFFPPAVILVPVADLVHVGETSDLIIAVDGSRVTDYLEFADRMRDIRPGEIIYLSVIRNGARVQVPVQLPATLPAPVF
jgi:PDZ domain